MIQQGWTLAHAFDSVLEHGPHYDAIIVDEGQDFRDEWWPIVQASLNDPAHSIFYIFHDDRQALLPYRASYPFDQPIFELSRNCRNAGRVYAIMRRTQPSAPASEPDLIDLGQVRITTYQAGREQAAIQEETLPFINGASVPANLVALLGGAPDFEGSPLAKALIPLGNAKSWRDAVQRKFLSAMKSNKYDRRGLMLPLGGDREVIQALNDLSGEPYPTSKDVDLVRAVAGSFQVHPDIRRSIVSNKWLRNAIEWRLHEDRLLLWRPWAAKLPLLAAEVILHFEREDWHAGIPPIPIVKFEPHYRCSSGSDAIPVIVSTSSKG